MVARPPKTGIYSAMTVPHFFGYGSLVNAATHTYPDPLPATVKGWRRMWRHTTFHDAAFLTVTPDPTCSIEGLLAHVPGDDWAALDQRESGYFRTPVPHTDLTHSADRAMSVQIYQTRTDKDAITPLPILRSYLDVVVQGYLQVFGEDGAKRFFETTSGWEAPIRDDRANPQYPRAQTLSTAETAFVDDCLAAHVKHV